MAFDAPLDQAASDRAIAVAKAEVERLRLIALKHQKEEAVQAEIRRMLYRRGC